MARPVEIDRWRSGLRAVLEPPPKRRARRLLRAIGVLVLLVIAASTAVIGVTYRYAEATLAKISRQPCPGCGAAPGDPITILFIGSDTRADIPRSEASHFCLRPDCSDMAGPQHGDAIMLLRLFPAVHRAALLSIPRDLNVHIAGTEHRDRINAAYAGGPAELVDTIRDDLGIPIDHFVDADFVGFRSIVAVLGGLNVYFPTPMRDVLSGLYVPTAGCVHLDANAVLAYVRSRHAQFLVDGYWQDDPLSDLSRVKRQQDFMRRLMRRLEAIRNPFTAKRVIDSSVHYFKLDAKFTLWDGVRLVRAMRGISPDTLQASTLPVEDYTVGGAAELRLAQPQGSAAIDAFLRGPSSSAAAAPATSTGESGGPPATPSPASRC